MNETPPPLQESSDDKIWIVLCHLFLLLGVGLLFPLIVYLLKRKESGEVARNAREALNFHISVPIYGIVSALSVRIFTGIVLFPIVAIGSVVLAIIGTVKASQEGFYRYPLTLRLV